VTAATGREERFRKLYAREAGPRLSRLGSRALELEGAAQADPALVEEMFRDAHTLKGGALVVGLTAATDVAHALEDVLEALRARTATPTPQVVDTLLAAIDAFPSLLQDGAEDSAESLVARLREQLAPRPDATTPAEPPPPAPGAVPTVPTQDEVLRVPITRLERLRTLTEEALGAQERLARSLADKVALDADDLAEFRELTDALVKLADQTLKTRMVPVSSVLEPLSRVVREASRTLGKQVRYELRGGATELDIAVLKLLVDPLLQLVRNAVDHGIEPPDERRAAGKDPVGTIRLTVTQRGREVALRFTDDGRGVDVDRVRARAVTRGRDTGALSDDETVALVFTSGLSTAETVTPMSGRGVGLDVVSAAASRMHGRVEVRSARDQGAEFRITVPLTLAILPCRVVEAGGRRVALPLTAVVAVLPEGEDGEGIPRRRLAETLGLDDGGGPSLDIVVVDGDDRRVVFSVDRLGPQRDVVLRGLSPLLPPLGAVAGVSTEPGGSILVVLDPGGLLDRVL
jgi:two-component system chemotaxis sensor kinase CheA